MQKSFNLNKRSLIYCFVLFGFFLCLSQNSLAQNITLKFKETPLKGVLKEIQKQTDYRFVYNNNLVNVESPVTIDVLTQPLNKVLDQLLVKNKIEYQISGKQILLAPKILSNTGPQKEQGKNFVSGLVRDSYGNPLAGVFIQSNLSKEITTSDENGRFLLFSTTIGESVKFSLIGMKSQVIEIGTKKEFEVVLQEDILQLENVVVTGYYSLSKERSAGAFNTLSSNVLSEKASGSIIERLSGSIPGLVVNKNDGAADKYLIRGASSINSSREPLIVVDGTPMAASTFESTVSPEDVASVTVLKDATASSIWGAKAANGVIVVTTKRGSFQSKLSVNYTGNIQMQGKPDFSYLNYMNAEEYVDFAVSVFDEQIDYAGILSSYGIITPIERAMYNNKLGLMSNLQLEEYLNTLRNSDNTEQINNLLYRNKISHQHNLKISGGSEKNAFQISFDYKGTYPGMIETSTNRVILDIKNDARLTDWLKVSAGLNLTSSLSNSKGQPDLTGMVPYELLQNQDGSYNSIFHHFYSDETKEYIMSELSLRNETPYDYKIMEELYKQSNRVNSLNARFNGALQLRITKGMEFESKFMYQKGVSNSEQLYDPDSYYVRNLRTVNTPVTAGVKSRIPAGYIFNKSDNTSYDWNLRNQLSYNNTFNKNTVSAILGTEIRKNFRSNFNKIFYGYNPANRSYAKMDEIALAAGVGGGRLSMPNSGTSPTVTFSDFGTGFIDFDDRFFSLYSNIAYDYEGRYALNASVRMDQANLFGVGVRYKPIWSVGAVWNISKEKFFSVEWIDQFSIRASRGIAGNTPNSTIGGPFDIVSSGSTNFYVGNIPSSTVLSPALKNLRWEKTNMTNFGIDISLLKNRLYGSIDYYSKKSIDLIGSQSTDPTRGFSSINTNIGVMKNSGVEFLLNSINVNKSSFKWSTSLNLSYNKNNVEDIYIEPIYYNYIYGEGFIAGYPAYSLFSYKWAGLNNIGEPTIYDAEGNISEVLVTDVEAIFHSGTTQPPIYGGVSNTFKYNRFSLWFQMIYQFGGVVRKDLSTFTGDPGRLGFSPVPKLMNDAWKSPGDEQKTDIAKWLREGDPSRAMDFLSISDKSVISSSYLLLSDISLSYDIPERLLNKAGVKSSSLILQITDPYMLSLNTERIDPRYISTRTGKYGAEYTLRLVVNF